MILPKYIPASIKKDIKTNTWYFGNQISTYELCIRIQSTLNKDDEWLDNLYNTVKLNPLNYGTYAGNNNWSPVFTDSQLTNFISLIN